MAGAFEYRQAEEIRDAFARRGVRYLVLGKSGMILPGFPDTTQDADVHVEKTVGFEVCHPDDIIASKVAANRVKDRESLGRRRLVRDWVESRAAGRKSPNG